MDMGNNYSGKYSTDDMVVMAMVLEAVEVARAMRQEWR